MSEDGVVGVVAVAAVALATSPFLWANAVATRWHEKRMQRERRVETYREFATFMHMAGGWAGSRARSAA